eukprot:TRINITY_DN6287_c0_g1_i1.p1 TRINITY_DN6287_c0_g1~~TRINITY_DN6287_c0_g1_i1.p1  ORF type:complete len:941 (-),score=322.77 TRINITY_DN6287_c0_g1_i1:73-2895(-)
MVWKTQERKGKSLVTNPLLFTPDSKFFFGTAENQINLYPTSQKHEILRVLNGHTDLVTSLALDSNNPQLLFSASVDGTIKVWNFVTSTLLHSYSIGHPILELQYSSSTQTLYYVTRKTQNFRLGSCLFDSQDNHIEMKNSKMAKLDAFPRGMILTPSNKHIVLIYGSKLLVYRTKDSQKFRCTSQVELLSVAVSSKDCVAVGCSTGEVYVFLNLFEDIRKKYSSVEQIPSNKLHWHTKGADCMVFSDDGESIATGGAEETLNITNIQSGKQHFFSKMGSTLRSVAISPDESHYAICLSDNVIRVYDAFKRLCVKKIVGFKNDPHQGLDWKGSLSFYPRSSRAISVSGRSSLQCFDLAKEHAFSEHEILPVVGITTDESMRLSVSFFAYNFDGTSLATVDYRTLNSMENEASLKFWSLDGKHKNYLLHTSVTDNSLGIQYTSLSFNPKHEMVLTTNSKGRFNVWEKDISRGSESWNCKWDGEYKKEVSNCGCWSEDGSLFAVGFGNSLTIWNPNQPAVIQAELIHPGGETVNRAAFLSKSPFLVTCTERHVYLWNIFTLSIHWSFSASSTHLATDAMGRFLIYIQKTIINEEDEAENYSNGRFMVNKPEYKWESHRRGYQKDPNSKTIVPLKRKKVEGNLVLFSSQSPVPLAVWNTGSDPIQSVALRVENHKGVQSMIAYITKSQEVFSIEEVDVDHAFYQAEQADAKILKPLEEEVQISEFNLIEKNIKDQQVESKQEKVEIPAFSSISSSVFNRIWDSYPVHALPLPSSLYSTIMDGLVKKKVSDVQTTDVHRTKSNGIENTNEENKEENDNSSKKNQAKNKQFNLESMVDFFREMNVSSSSSSSVTIKKREREEKSNGKSEEEVKTPKREKNAKKNTESIEKNEANGEAEENLKKSSETPKTKEKTSKTPKKVENESKGRKELNNSTKKIKRKVDDAQ